MLAWSFRWAEGGNAILDALPSMDVAPPVEIGGASAYDPARPWAVRLGAASVPRVGPFTR